jgi:hypothetical protein
MQKAAEVLAKMGKHQQVHIGYQAGEELVATELLFGSSRRALFTVRVASPEVKYFLLSNKIKSMLHEFRLTDCLFKNWLLLFRYRLQYLAGKLEIMKASHAPVSLGSRITHNLYLQQKLEAEKNASGNQASYKAVIPENEKVNYLFYSGLKDQRLIDLLDKRQRALESTKGCSEEVKFMGEHRLHWDLKSMSKLLNKDGSPLSPEERIMHVKTLFGPGCKALERIIDSTDTPVSQDLRSATSIWKRGTGKERSRKESVRIPIAFKNHDRLVKGLPLKNRSSSSFELGKSPKSRINIEPLFEEIRQEKMHRTQVSDYVVNSQRIMHNRAQSWGELRQAIPKSQVSVLQRASGDRRDQKKGKRQPGVKILRNQLDLMKPPFCVMSGTATSDFYGASTSQRQSKKLNILFRRNLSPI